MTFAACTDCAGEVVVGQFEPITVSRVDDEGFPIFDEQNRIRTITLKLPRHRADTLWARQEFDPTGMAPASCAHGAPTHPTGRTHPFAVSWIRAKYLQPEPMRHCPVCRGEERPADMTEPRA